MKLKRIKLVNFKDVLSREVEFPPVGVTVIQGPNEIGKSAIQQALDMLLDYPADSAHHFVKAQRPVGRDVAPEVELDATCGPYAFSYYKRFDSTRPETSLRIYHPTPEQKTGREAHDRVSSILRENLDLDLWRAVRVQQGVALGKVKLSNSRSLLTALDAAADTVPANEGELTLFDRVVEEAKLYFTEKDLRPLQRLRESRQAVEELEASVSALTDQLAQLDKTIENKQWVDGQLDGLSGEIAQAQGVSEQRAAELRHLEELEVKLQPLHANAEAVKARHTACAERLAHRRQQAQSVEHLEQNVGALAEKTSVLQADLQGADAENTQRSHVSAAGAMRRDVLQQLYEIRRGDYEFRQNELGLAQLIERHDRVLSSREAVVEARELIQRTKITTAGLKRIDDRRLDLEKARAALSTGSPTLILEAHADLKFQMDGEDRSLSVGEVLERTIADRVELRVPDLLKLGVRSGASVESLTQQVRAAEKELARLLKSNEVGDREQANRQLRDKENAERTIREAERREKEDLRDLTADEMAEKIVGLRQRTASYLATRPAQPEMGASIEQCDERRTTAEREAEAARRDYDVLDGRVKATDQRLQRVRLQVEEGRAQLNIQGENLTELARSLTEARASVADEVLEHEVSEAAAAATEAQSIYTAEQRQLSELVPTRVRSLAANAEATLEKLRNQLEDLSAKQLRLATELELREHDGLSENLDKATAELEQRRREWTLLERRAAGAKHLLEVMRDCRDEARRRREVPLRERITELGSLLHGASFSVELDDELSVARRTLNGTTLDFAQLSAGAQEQLSLIARLAAGMIVAGDGGVPIILDDTLGYTDEDRLEYMGAILTRAGEKCQVIVLTSYPRRYAYVGNATIVTVVGRQTELPSEESGAARSG